ncbi:hypothetical protein AXK58_24455 [Tsukamurella tyrosinosolvens]|nr:hypothetical protein AXK58_24455 [Tsukamurella tyrosinosolvens]
MAEGTFVGKSPLTVAEAIEQWLKGQRGERNTRAAREAALAPVVKQYGKLRAQAITKHHVEQLLDALVGGRIDGVQDRSARYTNVTRSKWSSCWEDLVAQGVLPRNVVALVKPLKETEPTDETTGSGDAIDESRRLTDEQITALVKAHAPYTTTSELSGHAVRSERSRLRRGVFVELALLGLRRAELAGLRWSAISGLHGKAATLSIVRTRVAASGLIEEKRKGKTGAARRTLLLPPSAAEALRRHQLVQIEDKKRSGARWRGDKDLAILTVDNGAAVSPRTLDDWWHAAMDAAGINGYRLHDMRHTCASRLLSAGVPLMDVATWLGHADGGVLALRVYGHTDPKDLGRAAAALAHP